MKRRIALSIALALSVALVSLTRSDSTAQAQQRGRSFSLDTGIVPLGQSQVLRVTVATGDINGDGPVSIRFRQVGYTQGACSDGVCKLNVASQTTSAPVMLGNGEGASIDIPASFQGGVFVGVRGVVLSNRRNVRVTAIVFDTSTQRVVTFVNTTFDDES